jgi:hypothetical protein
MWQRTILNTILTVLVCLFAMAVCANAKTIYVDGDAAGANDGSTWADAYNYLQDALMFATGGDEIRVAQGVYRPDEFVLSKRPNLGREETFHLKNGVTIKGGYAGLGAPNPDVRDVERYQTTLSGDRDGDDEADFLNNDENSYHVVIGSGTDETAILAGFTVCGGNADGNSPRPYFGTSAGGGAYIHSGSLSPPHQEWFDQYGGGACIDSGTPTLTNCTFTGNSAGRGGGMYNTNSNPTVINCVFKGNSVEAHVYHPSGSTMDNWGSSPTVANCIFPDGQIANWGSAPTIRNCLFTGNSSIQGDTSTITVVNCTFTGNAGTSPAAVWDYSTATFNNCIFWGNGPTRIYHDCPGTTVTFTYSNILGGQTAIVNPCDPCDPYNGLVWGEGNIDVDPCFAQPGYWDPNGTPQYPNDDFWVDGDYHLKSQAGRWDPNTQTWIIDEVTSPCIDAGDPASPIGPEPFPNGGIINMGAYGGTAEASKSYFNKPPCDTIVAGDINGDCAVDSKDFALMALHWLGGR